MHGAVWRALPMKGRIKTRSALQHYDCERTALELTFSDWSAQHQSHVEAGVGLRLFEWC
jgi:hypothetical protein